VGSLSQGAKGSQQAQKEAASNPGYAEGRPDNQRIEREQKEV